MVRRTRVLDYAFVAFIVLILIGIAAALIFYRRVNYSANYTAIEPGLYMGGQVRSPPWGTSAVLNLRMVKDSYQTTHHKWSPIRDAVPSPSLQWLRKQVEFVEASRNKGRITFVHCTAGVSRSGMVVVAYIMRAKKWRRDRALAYVRVRRPQVRPNTAFMKLLLEWEKEIGLNSVEQ